MRIEEIAKWLGLACDKTAAEVTGFRQDSREVACGDLFFAIKGERVDGHDYLSQVADQGAVAAVVSTAYQGQDCGLILLRTGNVLAALHQLATIVLKMRRTRLVGVTGSVGKTTTKEFVATLLNAKFQVGKTLKSANSQVGAPLGILNSQGDEEVFVMEMGMSQPKELEKLVAIAPPEVALVTKIALAHAAFFPDGLEGIAAAKCEILSHPSTRIGVLNHQVAKFRAAQQGSCQKLTYACEEEGVDADFILCREPAGWYVQERGARSPVFVLPFEAHHLRENFLGAAVVSRQMGLSWEEIISQARDLKVSARRFERIERSGIVFINDSYNANATSMRAALTNLPATEGKKIAVLGAMKELGSFTEACHREVAEVALEHVDLLLCFGEECVTMVDVFAAAGRPVEHFLEFEPLKRRVTELARQGDLVLLKGSNSKQLWRILED